MNPALDEFFDKAEKWQKEMERLRAIILDCGLSEELKWGAPCYTYQNRNIVIMNGLKESCALAFFKGALLFDAHGILTKPGENTQEGRWMKFTSVKQIAELEQVLKSYIYEAVEVEKMGLKVRKKETADYPVPEEFQNKFNKMPALKAAFEALTPGRQRAYLLHFAAPKQSGTRAARVEKYLQQILDGKGLNDDYMQKRK